MNLAELKLKKIDELVKLGRTLKIRPRPMKMESCAAAGCWRFCQMDSASSERLTIIIFPAQMTSTSLPLRSVG